MKYGIDENRNPITNNAAFQNVALFETYDATISASTAITLQVTTKVIEVTALDKGIFLKWGGTAVSTDFDGFIAPNTSKVFPIPNGQTTANFIEESATAKLVVIEYA